MYEGSRGRGATSDRVPQVMSLESTGAEEYKFDNGAKSSEGVEFEQSELMCPY